MRAAGLRTRSHRHQPLAHRHRHAPGQPARRAAHLRTAGTRRSETGRPRRTARSAGRQPRVHAPQQRPRRPAGLRPAARLGLDHPALGRSPLHPQHPHRERSRVRHLGTGRRRRPPAAAQVRRDVPRLPAGAALARVPRRGTRADRGRLRRPDHAAAAVHPRRPAPATAVAGTHPRAAIGRRVARSARLAQRARDHRLVDPGPEHLHQAPAAGPGHPAAHRGGAQEVRRHETPSRSSSSSATTRPPGGSTSRPRP